MPWTGRAAVWGSALAVAAFEVVGSFGAADNQPERQAVDALALVLILLGPAALAVRDRHPRFALVVAIASTTAYISQGYPYGPIFVSVVVALFTVVQAGHRRDAWVLAGVGYGAFVVAYLADPRREGSAEWLHWSLVAGWLVVVLAVSELVRTRRVQLGERARAAAEERQRRAGEQRLGLAQELHDVLAHNISLINVQASVALHLLDDQPDQARPALTAIKAASHDALQELRGALDLLRHGDEAAPRAPAPGVGELEALVEGVRGSGLDVRLEAGPPPAGLPAAVQLATYRIVQEALTNVTRHASARSVVVRVGYDHGVAIEILDDGTGAGPGDPSAGNGIQGMRERAAALGGSVDAGPRPEGGFRVMAHLPAEAP